MSSATIDGFDGRFWLLQIEQSTEPKWGNLVLSVVGSLIVRIGGVGSSHPNPEMKHGLSPTYSSALIFSTNQCDKAGSLSPIDNIEEVLSAANTDQPRYMCSGPGSSVAGMSVFRSSCCVPWALKRWTCASTSCCCQRIVPSEPPIDREAHC